MADYQYKNILFEYKEFEDCIGIIDVRITQSTTNKVFKIPAKINGKPVTSFSRYGMYNDALYIKDFTDIIIPSTIRNICNIRSLTPLNIHVDSLDYYFKISSCLYFGRNSKLYINNSLITTLKLNPNISCVINSLQVDTIDCVDLINSINVTFYKCDINKIINTDNIKIISYSFSVNTNWKKPLYFPNVTIIDTGSFIFQDTHSIKLICPNLVFIESNIISSKTDVYCILPTIHIKSDSKPIIYPQKYKINVNDCYTSGNH